MTEKKWLEAADLQAMTLFACAKASDPKLHLAAVAFCRGFAADLLPDERSRKAVDAAEEYALGRRTAHQLMLARGPAEDAARQLTGPQEYAAQAAAYAALYDGRYALTGALTRTPPLPGEQDALKERCRLLHHVLGNPFRPYPAPPSWPSTVVQLAESLYDGQDCAFALHDALLEAGHAELAEHFWQETWHPKGCWAMDLILGKS